MSLVRGLQRITAVDPGWRGDGVLAARLNLVGASYAQLPARRAFFDRLRDSVVAIPGVTSAAISSSSVPVGPFSASTSFAVESRTEPVLAYNERVTPEYFETLRIPLRHGRLFRTDDRAGSPPVMVINETMARTLWPGQDPIGKRIGFPGSNLPPREVVGVVGDVTFPSFRNASSTDTEFEVYQPLAQTGTAAVNVLLRTSLKPDAAAADLRRAVSAIDHDLPVYGMTTAVAAEQRQTADLQLLADVLAAFAALGLVLAAIGIFGVVAYSTAQRAREIGMRIALGARQSGVLWLVLRQGFLVTIAGTLVGLAGGVGLGRLLASMMPNLPPAELVFVLGAGAFMVAIALGAFAIPAWRASKTNPMRVLRQE